MGLYPVNLRHAVIFCGGRHGEPTINVVLTRKRIVSAGNVLSIRQRETLRIRKEDQASRKSHT